ncbi:TolC family protein [Pseudogulbenkiania subflava]|uniref:Outer membrane protein, cobalt-zinc-cadmium efflux system n=1 Tax=Pseudogulbenkiania subflava DSM 22618 TaxID=1123014 RepID=A0A1Y6BHF4_9NEIS|nr:TolC family protein [Pseudogulbenkiania subflava]SMF03618.1 outer membrane protein, cobalt-zinc-cadmium efflux system [Pseudogulbenkiania subflava DSM 22618]
MPYPHPFYRGALGVAALWLGLSAPLSAATLKDALDHAWAAYLPAQSARTAQFDAQDAAARAWLPEPPTLTLSGRSDQLDGNAGRREWEAEVGVPLWLWGQRDRAGAVAQGERDASMQGLAQQRWQLAGELREAWWEVRLAQVELDATDLKLKEASRLEADVARRVKAGDLAPLDQNLARSTVSQAKSERLRAQAALTRAQGQFAALSRGARVPDQDEILAGEIAPEQHPQLQELAAKASVAQAKLQQAAGDTRNNPELAFTVTRERDSREEAYQNLAKIAIKIPFGSSARNQPRITAANAELIEAQLARDSAQRKLAASVAASRAELEQSRGTAALQQERLQLAEQSFVWVDKAFQAGQLELPALIRAETELADARLQAARTRSEAARAVSRYNQAVGALP